MSKSIAGNFFEDFAVGQQIIHATPRTVTDGDVSIYAALHGARFVLQSADAFAQAVGYAMAPVDDLLVFHIVFGKTVPDISLNAVANLGYAECSFLRPVFAGDTLSARSEVIGLKENSNGKTGVVYVRSQGFNQRGEEVLSFVRWVMVNKRDAASPAPAPAVPALASSATVVASCPPLRLAGWDNALSGSAHRFGDYAVGEKIDHRDGTTVERLHLAMAERVIAVAEAAVG